MYLHRLGGLEEDPAGQDALTTCPPGRRGPRATASPASSAPSPPALCLAQDLAASQSGGGGGSRGLMAPQLLLFPVLNVRRITLPEVVVPFPLGTPKTRVRQGVLGDVGDHSWEGCGTSPESRSTSSHPGFDNLSSPHLWNARVPWFPPWAATRRPGLGSGPGCPEVPPTWRLQQRMVLPRQAPEMRRCRGSPGFGRILSCLAQSPGREASPPRLSFSPEKQMPSHGAVVGSLPQFTVSL